jgi:iron(III) transport system substrate-binding protein
MRARRLLVTAVAASTALALTACGGDAAPTAGSEDDGTLTIYSGRSEKLVAPLLEELEAEVGTEVEVRYAGSSELAAQLLEEGEATEADLFFSQDAGALGALAKAGRLAELPPEVTGAVAEGYVDDEGRWVATSARARVVAYNPQLAPEATGFSSIDAILDEKYRGKIAYAPTNASFQAFVTALRVQRGEDAAKDWLERFAALEPQAFDGNVAVLDAVDGGQAALGLINHYYWYQKTAEVGADAVTAQLHFLAADDPGALVNVAGAGVIAGAEEAGAAEKAVAFLLSERAQQYFADETAEYPVVPGVTSTKHQLQPIDTIRGSQIDLNELDSLDATLALLDEVGLT